MVDLIFLGVSILTVAIVVVRRTSAGVAILCLLAGVLLDQMLTTWILGELPTSRTPLNDYLPVTVRLLVTFIPVAASLLSVKVYKNKAILSLLTSLFLGFMIIFFGIQVVNGLPNMANHTKNSGLLSFVAPYQNQILAAGAVLAVIEMVASHRHGATKAKSKKKKD